MWLKPPTENTNYVINLKLKAKEIKCLLRLCDSERSFFLGIFKFLSLLSVAAFQIFNLTHTKRKKIQNILPVSEMYKPVPITTMNWVHIWSSRDRWQLKSKCSWENGIGLERNRQNEVRRSSIKIMRWRSSPV